MGLRPPGILWRMLLGELLRQFALATTVLVVVIAFAATLRPLAEGQLAPGDALRFMGYAALPMLQFAMPFAAAFAATLTYHRLGADNEALAASAGGVSYPSLLAPAIALGVALTISMGLLTFEVVPNFSRAMKRVVAKDITRTLISGMQRGEAVDLNGLLIYADETIHLDDPGAAADRFVLEGVVAVATDDSGVVQTDVTAERADIRMYPVGADDGQDATGTAVALTLVGSIGMQRGEGLVETGAMALRPWSVPDALSEDPDFYDAGGLRRLRDRPDAISGVDRTRHRLAETLAMRELRNSVTRDASELRRIELEDELGQRVVISTRGLRAEGDRFEALPPERAGRVEVTRILQDGIVRRHLAGRAWLSLAISEPLSAGVARVDLQDVVTPEAEQAGRQSLSWDRLRIPNDPTPQLLAMRSGELLAESRAVIDAISATQSSEAEPIRDARRRLTDRIDRVRREIVGVTHRRAALSAACLIMTVLGAVMGLRLHESLPLPVYLWSFFPAMAAVITISGGASATKENAALGVVIAWTGVVALGLYAAVAFVRLRRH